MPHPGPPGPEQALLRVTAVGICGSDLHTFLDGRIGDISVQEPLIMGHEFGAVVAAVGENCVDGTMNRCCRARALAVDPAQPCGRCEMCEKGHPNLCNRLHFCGLYPDPGSLCEYMLMPAHTCFPVPDAIDDAGVAMLEPLGVAIHAIDLAKSGGRQRRHSRRRAHRPVCASTGQAFGRGPHLRQRQAGLAAEAGPGLGVAPINFDEVIPPEFVSEATGGRGEDVAIEAAWADYSVQQPRIWPAWAVGWCSSAFRPG